MSPDWSAKVEPVPYAKLGDPQTLNLYAYVGNNPMDRVDVDGHSGCKNEAAALCKAIMDAISSGMEAGAAMMGQKLKQLPASKPKAPGPAPMKGVNPVSGKTLFSPNPKGEPGHERPGVGGAGNYGACRGSGCSRTHQGEDVSGQVGADIYAATGGTVVFSGVSGSQTTGYGNTIRIDDGNGTVTTYSHNSENDVSVGDSVQRGEVIGTLGQTGNASGQPASESHVHFEVQVGGKRVDPATWLDSATD